MKKLFLLIMTISIGMTMCGTVTAMDLIPPPPPPPNPSNNTIGTTIIFWPKPKPGKGPRSASFAPITAVYDASLESINLSFMENLGDVTVTVINNTTGEQWFEYTDTSVGSAQIGISGGEGEYTIFIETEIGDSYYGEFSIC